MNGKPGLAALIDASIARWNGDLEAALFGAGDGDRYAELISAFCDSHLGTPADALLYRPGVGLVVGLRLHDGREVVLKIHRWSVSLARLAAVHDVQHRVHERGGPAPKPCLAPTPFGRGIATAEELLVGDDRPDGRDAVVRAVVATGLFELIDACRDMAPQPDVGEPMVLRPRDAPLWPEPHDLRFDFDGTSAGAEWIDEIAAVARSRLQHRHGIDVIGHYDWRVENLAFTDGRVSAIYDWDALAAAPEAVLVGTNAAQFCTDWTTGEDDPLPAVDDMVGFVEDFERARGSAFTTRERELLDAANLYLVAYGARCQHSDATHHPEIGGTPTNRWIRLLRERGERCLVEA